MTNTYILLKDLPDTKAGTKYIWNGFEYESEYKNDAWKREIVETRTDWFTPKIKNPPIGIVPEWLHKEQRLKELREAMSRYGSAEMEIPEEWENESILLEAWLTERLIALDEKNPRIYTGEDLRKAFEAGQHNGKNEGGINAFDQYLKCITS
jgi:hypothetical protein